MPITTGYWTPVAEDDGADWLIVKPDHDAGDNWYIATVHVAPDDGDVDANARLIAAAPDLLEALEAMVAGDVDVSGTALIYDADPAALLSIARAAIARATGAGA